MKGEHRLWNNIVTLRASQHEIFGFHAGISRAQCGFRSALCCIFILWDQVSAQQVGPVQTNAVCLTLHTFCLWSLYDELDAKSHENALGHYTDLESGETELQILLQCIHEIKHN